VKRKESEDSKFSLDRGHSDILASNKLSSYLVFFFGLVKFKNQFSGGSRDKLLF
jgi:hypothetical protein